MRRLVVIVLVLSAGLSAAWAVPATKQPIVRILADGRIDTTYLHGDEYGSYRTDARGRMLTKAPAYARAPQQTMRDTYVPSKGTVRIPVILVNFADYNFTISNPIEQFDDLFNGSGGSNPNATGSVHDYYIASSDSALDLHYEVFGVYTLSHNMEYYGEDVKNSGGQVTSHNRRARELVIEAAQLAVDHGVDLSVFDNNNDGYIDNMSIVVAGYNQAEGGEARTIWPHYSVISNSDRYSGKYLSGYLMISEYRSSGGKVQAGIGTYCHEFGHALGLPDLYDTSDSENYTVGNWDVMCSGCYNNSGSTPPSYTAFERFMMGWLTPTPVSGAGIHSMSPIETSNEALLLSATPHNLNPGSPNPSEYFLLENRQAVGWDAGKEALVGTGLLVSHVTFNRNNWDKNTFNNSHPLGFDIVSAGVSIPSKSSAADIFPGTTKRTSWLPTLNDGSTLPELNVSNIRQRSDGYISLHIGETGKEKLLFDQEEVSLVTTYMYYPEQYDTAHINLLLDSVGQETVRLILPSNYFSFSADNGESWYSAGDTVELGVHRDSTYAIELLAIHTPQRKNCDYVYTFFTAETDDESCAAQMTLAGRAPRPIYITTPVIDSIANLSATSFSIYWEHQEDAELYYYTLYTVSEGESEQTDTLDVLLSQTGKSVLSSRYMYMPDKISIGIDNTYVPNSVDSIIGGEVLIQGSADGENWEKVSTIHVHRTTKNTVRTFDIDTTHHWRQFRMEYTHLGGAGGTVIKDFTAHFDLCVNYLYPLYKYSVYALEDKLVFRDLAPYTTYYYAMQAYEEKGCEPHYTDLSEPIAITTKQTPTDPHLVVTRDAEGHYTVILPEMADGLHQLGIYDYMGRLVTMLRPAYGTTEVELPPLSNGQIHLVKYFQNRMGRKDMNAKVISY